MEFEQIEKQLLETRVKQIIDTQFFDFAVKEYITIGITGLVEVAYIDKANLPSISCDYAIPVLEYYWINHYKGQEWKNQVQEYLGTFKIAQNESYLVDGIEVNGNKIRFGEFHHLGFSRSGIDTEIHWADQTEPYRYQINALVMSGTDDLALLIAIARNCANSNEASAFAKFAYDRRNHRSWRDSALFAEQELKSFKAEVARFASS